MTKTKKIIAGLGAAGIAALGLLISSNKPPVQDLGNTEPFTIQEYTEYISMLNYELEQMGKKTEIKIEKGETYLEALNKKILSREIKEKMIKIGDKEKDAPEYDKMRKDLITKAENAFRK